MHRQHRGMTVGALALIAVATGLGVEHAVAQDVALSDRGPRFLFAATATSPARPLDVRRSSVLRQQLSLDLDGVTLDAALAEVTRQSGLAFVYSRDMLSPDARVNLRAEQITLAAALTEILLDAGVDVLLSSSGQAALVLREKRGMAQPGGVTGRVTDAKTGEGLAAAEVFLEGTRWRAGTGEDGRYQLTEVAPGSYTLVVRRIGYAKRTQAITVVSGKDNTVDLALEPVPTQLAELVTTVTGDQRRLELGHVVGRINADSLMREAPVTNVTELLTARVPGVQVSPTQGTVGGDVRVQIRGINSPNRTDAIVIVDGIRYGGDRGGPTGTFSAEPRSPLNDFNPNDIESIEIVKGSSAATLYGTDAANGVIVITTKRGVAGRAQWSTYGKVISTSIPAQHFPDKYFAWSPEFGGFLSCSLQSVASASCTQDSITVIPNPLNDRRTTVFHSRPTWEYGASVAGGHRDLRYYFSGHFEDATGPLQIPPVLVDSLRSRRGESQVPEDQLHPNAFTKADVRVNVSALLGEKLELVVSGGYTKSTTRSIDLFNSAYLSAFTSFVDVTNPYTASTPPEQVFARTTTSDVNRFTVSSTARWTPAPWFLLRGAAGLDLTSNAVHNLARRGEDSDIGGSDGQVGEDRGRNILSTVELTAAASFRRGRLSSRTAIGAQYVRDLRDAVSSQGVGLPPGGESIGQAASVSTSQFYAETATLGTYLEETAGLNDRLFVTGAFRADGASTFGRDYHAVFYPKAGVSWLVSQEPFLPHLPGLNELRLRYAYGASGLQPNKNTAIYTYRIRQVLVDGQVQNALTVIRGNPLLRPERVREHEFGFDASALAGGLRLEATWYRRKTVDQIQLVPLPAGLDFRFANIGLVTDRGFEAEVSVRPLDTRPLSMDLKYGYSSHNDKVVEIGDGSPFYDVNGGFVKGYPVSARFMTPLLGFTDANKNGIIESNEVQLGDSAVYVGRSTPPHAQTLTAVLSFLDRRLRISALFERRSGFTQVDQLKVQQCGFLSNCRAAVDPSTPLARQAEVAALGQAAPGFSQTPYTFVENGNFTRLREVSMAVDLPAGLLRAARVRQATLSLSARNLALWKSFSGPDPESAIYGSGGLANGITGGFAGGVPQSRTWSVRLDVGF